MLLPAAVASSQQSGYAGTAGDDNVGGTAGADRLAGGLGNDRIAAEGGLDLVSGGSGDDTLLGGADIDTITGDPGADTIAGGGERDYITGDAGDDSLDGQAGSNVIDGGVGNDFLRGGEAADSLNGGPDDDKLYGGDGDDGLSGASGRDHIFGGDGADRIEGGLGDDLISGGSGGDNIVSIDGAADKVSCGSGRDVVRADGGDAISRDCETVIERAGRFGKRPDTRQRPGSATASLGGGQGRMAQFPSPDECAERSETPGSPDGDSVVGDPGPDRIDSTLGSDCLFGGGGDDALSGGPNSDYLQGGDGINLLAGGSDRDVLAGGPLRDYAEGGPEDDVIDAGGGSNVVNGAVGNDRIEGGEFADSLNGGSDEDVMIGRDGRDGITGASGDDRIDGGPGADRIEGGLGKDTIEGGDGGDNIVAADGQVDEIRCGPGSDTVRADGEDKVDDDCELLIARRGSRYVEVPVSERPAAFGVADQSSTAFSQPLFRALEVRRTRLVTPWNQVHENPERIDKWLREAREAGVRDPLVAFNHAAGQRCEDGRSCAVPSTEAYQRAFLAFRARFPDVKLISPWNEANHESQPTAHRPDLAARYYNIVREHCRDCQIVAADVLDQKNMREWLEDFLDRAAGEPRIIGLHNYSDVNRQRTTGTRTLIDTLRQQARENSVSSRFQIWMTETGGIVRFETVDGRVAWPRDEARAADRLRYLYSIASKYRRYIRQVYIYQWRRTNPDDKFDAGLVNFDGSKRPSYDVVRSRSELNR